VSQSRTHRIAVQLRCRVDDVAHAASGRPVDGHPVEGEVVCEDGTVRPFSGWLGLVNELERVVAGAPPATV
jgi:hypothetical protein